jgi:DNA polymerase III subunit epsilon
MIPVTFIDLETTGLDPELHEIIEFAAIKTRIDDEKIEIISTAEFKIFPEYPVDPFIAKLNGYNEDQWDRESVSPEEALGGIFSLLRDTWHAGSNPKFDESFLKVLAKKLHWNYPRISNYHLLDVSTMAFPLLVNGNVERLKQETIAKYYGIDGGGHRAMADAMQCLSILAKLNNLKIVKSEIHS